MSHTQTKLLLYLIALLSTGGVIFNAFQIIIILAGGYNRNPDIESELLQTLDAIGLTVLWLVVSIAILFVTVRRLRQQ